METRALGTELNRLSTGSILVLHVANGPAGVAGPGAVKDAGEAWAGCSNFLRWHSGAGGESVAWITERKNGAYGLLLFAHASCPGLRSFDGKNEAALAVSMGLALILLIYWRFRPKDT